MISKKRDMAVRWTATLLVFVFAAPNLVDFSLLVNEHQYD